MMHAARIRFASLMLLTLGAGCAQADHFEALSHVGVPMHNAGSIPSDSGTLAYHRRWWSECAAQIRSTGVPELRPVAEFYDAMVQNSRAYETADANMWSEGFWTVLSGVAAGALDSSMQEPDQGAMSVVAKGLARDAAAESAVQSAGTAMSAAQVRSTTAEFGTKAWREAQAVAVLAFDSRLAVTTSALPASAFTVDLDEAWLPGADIDYIYLRNDTGRDIPVAMIDVNLVSERGGTNRNIHRAESWGAGTWKAAAWREEMAFIPRQHVYGTGTVTVQVLTDSAVTPKIVYTYSGTERRRDQQDYLDKMSLAASYLPWEEGLFSPWERGASVTPSKELGAHTFTIRFVAGERSQGIVWKHDSWSAGTSWPFRDARFSFKPERVEFTIDLPRSGASRTWTMQVE